jgi:transcriptional regulator with XRE-family HTH domain
LNQERFKEVIADVIEAAKSRRRWSEEALAKELGVSADTLARLKDGSTKKVDPVMLVALFFHAGRSMDQAFGLTVEVQVPDAWRDEIERRLAAVEARGEVRIVLDTPGAGAALGPESKPTRGVLEDKLAGTVHGAAEKPGRKTVRATEGRRKAGS